MAVNLNPPTDLRPVPGIRLGTAAAGIRYRDRDDLVVMACRPETTTAAVFTTNRFRAAPVEVAVGHLRQSASRALVINAGNANAGTGQVGREDAVASCVEAAQHLDCRVEEVLPFSTGVIGERLPLARVRAGIAAASECLREDGWLPAARAIMTTDTVPKGATRTEEIDGVPVTVTGIAKGAGMIRPDMATMLAFVATDAAVESGVLQSILNTAVAGSFHRITVDGDTSTNDACVLLATGAAGTARIDSIDAGAGALVAQAVAEVMTELAQAVVRDAEGATRFITVEVNGGASERDCLDVAYTIAHSPLVKTACFAGDPNWGRILAAVGRAPVPSLELGAVSIYLNDVRVVQGGEPDPAYRESDGVAAMAGEELTIRVSIGDAAAGARIWTSDLSEEYVRINAEYRT